MAIGWKLLKLLRAQQDNNDVCLWPAVQQQKMRIFVSMFVCFL